MKKNNRLEAWLAVWEQGVLSPFPKPYRAFFHCFNAGDYYEAHDVLEHLWLQCTGADRSFYQGLIQLAGAFVHLQKHAQFPLHPTHSRRLAPAQRLFALSAHRLRAYPQRHLGLDLGAVLQLCADWSERASVGENPLERFAPPVLVLADLGGER